PRLAGDRLVDTRGQLGFGYLRGTMDERLAQSLIDWLIGQSLAGRTATELLTGLCERMVGAGVPLLRVSTASDFLHPTVGGLALEWQRDDATRQASHPRRATPEGAELSRQSPFDHLFNTHLTRRRWRFDESYRPGEFPMLDRLKDKGATDYLALVV